MKQRDPKLGSELEKPSTNWADEMSYLLEGHSLTPRYWNAALHLPPELGISWVWRKTPLVPNDQVYKKTNIGFVKAVRSKCLISKVSRYSAGFQVCHVILVSCPV